jgi:glycosyltransferase involved in cell wall biosynthesis
MDIKELLSPKTERQRPAKGNAGRRISSARNPRVSTPRISIIIPAHNEQAYLQKTLTALQRQEYPGSEIIVVANGCSDDTEKVARGHCDRLIVLSQKNLGVARNLGARMAKGDILIFLDADTLLEAGALRVVAELFQPTDAAGTVKGKPDAGRLAYRLMYGMKNLIHRWRIHSGSSGVIICWRKDFIRLGGFDEHLQVRENSELIRRLKQFGRYRYIGKTWATTSMRRYERRGFWRMIWLWTKLWFESLFRDLRHRQYETIR